MKALIIKKEGIDIQKQIKELENRKWEIVKENPDYIFSFGGDGTVLKSKNEALKYEVPILAINFGKIAYMADIEAKDFTATLEHIEKGNFNRSKRYLLECKINDKIYYALNEIAFKFDIIGELELYEGQRLISTFRGDGLILSSSTGSTAYAMSSGGSIIHTDLKVINIVSIASQYLAARPIILPDVKLCIKSNANIFIDGKKLEKSDIVEVKYSDKYIELIELKDKDYYYMLKSKLDWKV